MKRDMNWIGHTTGRTQKSRTHVFKFLKTTVEKTASSRIQASF